jgi:hypothetical protein
VDKDWRQRLRLSSLRTWQADTVPACFSEQFIVPQGSYGADRKINRTKSVRRTATQNQSPVLHKKLLPAQVLLIVSSPKARSAALWCRRL